MKRIHRVPMRILATMGLLLLMGLGSMHPVQAQAIKDRGQEAQAGLDEAVQIEEIGQMDEFRKLGGEAKSTSGPGIHDSKTAPATATTQSLDQTSTRPSHRATTPQWDEKWMQKFRPQKPHKPVPVVLILLGSLMVFLWTLLLLGVVFAASTGAALLLFILMLVFIPMLIVGIIFIIGGIVAATSGGRPPQAMRR